MKGLLLKDWYMAKKYCRAYILLAAVFFASAFLNDNSLFFIMYPCILMAVLPVTLLAYDERCKWDVYAQTLPCSRKQFVSEKYIFGIIAELIVLVFAGIVCAAKASRDGSMSAGDIFELLAVVAAAASLVSSICMPFMFKMGVEKGRLAYYVMIGFVCALSVTVPALLDIDMQSEIPVAVAPIALVAAVLIYALSWRLSVSIYQKREL